MLQIVLLYKKLLTIYYTMADFDAMRQNMIHNQILTNKVTHSGLIQAVKKVKRENFLPDSLRTLAYAECDLEIASGRFMLAPMVLSRLIQAADIQEQDSVLVIGAGTGYGCAVLGFLCGQVLGIEENAQLYENAQQNLMREDYTAVKLQQGPLIEGWAANAPYDVIIVEGSLEHLPLTIKQQLSERGGRLLYMKSKGDGIPAQAIKLVHNSGAYTEQVLFEAHAPELPAFKRSHGFTFG